MRAPPLVALLLLAAACGPISISGTVSGRSLDTGQAVARFAERAPLRQLDLTIGGGDATDLCIDLSRQRARRDATYLKLVLTSNLALTPGTVFTVGDDAPKAEGFVRALDESCGQAFQTPANSGTVTIDSVTDVLVTGSFELVFGADAISGSFEAPTCENVQLGAEECL